MTELKPNQTTIQITAVAREKIGEINESTKIPIKHIVSKLIINTPKEDILKKALK